MIRDRSFKLLSPDELEEIGRELRSLAPRVGPAIERRLFGKQPGICFSFRQLDLFTSVQSRNPRHGARSEHLHAIDGEIVLPILKQAPKRMDAQALMVLTADWIEGRASALRSQPQDAPPWPAIRASAITDLACRCWIDASLSAKRDRDVERLCSLAAPPARFEVDEDDAEETRDEDGSRLDQGAMEAIALELARIAPLLGPVLDREMFTGMHAKTEPITVTDIAGRTYEMENGLPDDALEEVIESTLNALELPPHEHPPGATAALIELGRVLRLAGHAIDHGTVGDAKFRGDVATVMGKILGGSVIDAAVVVRRPELARRLATLIGAEHRLSQN